MGTVEGSMNGQGRAIHCVVLLPTGVRVCMCVRVCVWWGGGCVGGRVGRREAWPSGKTLGW